MGSYQITCGADQIFRIYFDGYIEEADAQAYRDEIVEIFEQESEPIRSILYVANVRRVSGGARRIFREVGQRPMSGESVVLGTNRYLRVAATFVIRAVGKNTIRVMDEEEEAVKWLQSFLASSVDSVDRV